MQRKVTTLRQARVYILFLLFKTGINMHNIKFTILTISYIYNSGALTAQTVLLKVQHYFQNFVRIGSRNSVTVKQ